MRERFLLRYFLVLSCLLGLVLLSTQGCLATRGWVQEQMTPLASRLTDVEGHLTQTEGQLGQVDRKTEKALERLDNLRLERRVVLSLKDGADFGFDSAAMTPALRRQIDSFLKSMHGVDDAQLVVAGHTDNTGPANYNYELAQQRAANVAKYLIRDRGVDPLHITVVSYGASAPLGDNRTAAGRRKNRRVEILVFKEDITSSPGHQRLDLGRGARSQTSGTAQ